MTEKHYGGETGFRSEGKASTASDSKGLFHTKDKTTAQKKSSQAGEIEGLADYIKAGKIAHEAVNFAKSLIKPNMPLLEIADKIEAKIIELGGKPAFPVNLSVNEIADHYTPAFNDTAVARGLMNVDLGVHINGCIADTAFTLDLENSDENKKLIEASSAALASALKEMKIGTELRSIGKVIEKEIKSRGFHPIINLAGHLMEPYSLHSGLNIPNYDNSQAKQLESGVYAIEPFATLSSGSGLVRDGRPSGIFMLEKSGNVRDSFAREVLAFIEEEYQTLPFCSRWIYKKFSSRGLLALRRIEEAGLLHVYNQLIESNGKKVSQAEHTIIITESEKIITTQ